MNVVKLKALWRHKWFGSAVGAVLTVICGLVLWKAPLGEAWVNASYDYLFRFGARPAPPDPVEAILMDNEAFHHFSQERRQPWDRGLHAQLLQKLAELLEANLEETDFTVHKMCERLHLSHMQFIRKIKQLTGKKPIDLLKSFRLKRAKDLLRQNNMTVAEIAYKVGYDMPNSFSRAFKKEFGISPTEFVG